MPRTDPAVVTRHLNAEEREIRRLYLLEHPEDDLRLPPFTSGYAEIQDWHDARQAAAASPAEPEDEDVPEDAPRPVWTVVE